MVSSYVEPNQNRAFSLVKSEFAKVTTFPLYDPEAPTTVPAEASTYVLGAVLLQKVESEWKPVAYASHSMMDTEHWYTQIKRGSRSSGVLPVNHQRCILSQAMQCRNTLVALPLAAKSLELDPQTIKTKQLSDSLSKKRHAQDSWTDCTTTTTASKERKRKSTAATTTTCRTHKGPINSPKAVSWLGEGISARALLKIVCYLAHCLAI